MATAESINNLLTRKGISATVRTYPALSFDPDTNRTSRGSASDYTHYVIPPYKNREGWEKEVLITSGKGLTGFANYNLSFTVQAGLEIIIASKTWTVIGVQEVKDSTGVLLYLLEIETGS